MNEIDQQITDHLEMLLNKNPELRTLLSAMLIQDKGDLTAFVESFRIETLKIFTENFAGNGANPNKNNIGEHGVCGDVRAEILKAPRLNDKT